MRIFIFVLILSLSSSVWASSSTDCTVRLLDSFEVVTVERWPEVLKEFFGVDLVAKPAATLTWSGSVTAIWVHPKRGDHSKAEETSSVRAVFYRQTEVDGSLTTGIDLVGLRAFGHFGLDFNNFSKRPFTPDTQAAFYSPSAKVLILTRKDAERGRDQVVQFMKTKTDQLLYIFDNVTIRLPDGSQYLENAVLKVAP